MEKKKCKFCDKDIINRVNNKYCNRTCEDANKKKVREESKRVKVDCKWCGKEVTNPRSTAYCNRTCSAQGFNRMLMMKSQGISKEEYALREPPKIKPKPVKRKGGFAGKKPYTEREKVLKKDILERPEKVHVRHSKPPKRKSSTVDFDFLKYNYIIFKWALENNPSLTRSYINILLFLYSEGAFSKTTFNIFWKPMGLRPTFRFNELLKGGWINIYREKRGNLKPLYILSTKAKHLCSSMHRTSMGYQKISENKKYNKMLDKDTPRNNTYYLELIKKMNKKVTSK